MTDTMSPFAGGDGRLGPDLEAVEWSATPLGPPVGWDRSLRAMVRVLIGSRFAMWMAWGPELTFFCNDAYRRATLGTKYPWALGRPAQEVWAEIWSDIGPRIARVLETGEATWDESLQLFLERSGYPEETYHTFSYSPLADDAGVAVGMLCVVSEETERVIGELRLATLRDLGSEPMSGEDATAYLRAASRHLAANPQSLPFTLTYLFGQEGRAELASSTGIVPGHVAAPATLASDDLNAAWPVAELSAGRMVVADRLERRFSDLPTGPWPLPPHTAVALPLAAATRTDPPVGFLVVGTNRYRPLDDGYLAFLRLIAAQLASGVTSVRAYEAERLRAEKLAELDRAKTAFFTNVSHELRTPLTLLLGPAEDALSEQGLAQRERARFEMIARNGHRLLKLVGQLLDFSRLESGESDASFQPIDLSARTTELASMFESAMTSAGLELTIRCEPLREPVYVDPEMWAKIVFNLISNALKFTLAGSVAVLLVDAGEHVRLTVRDTGIGIRPEDQADVFERFRRVSEGAGRTHEGSGIGLALVAELTALHGGQVAVTSELGHGSAFSVELPFGFEHLPPDQIVPVAPQVPVPQVAAGFLTETSWWAARAAGSEPTPAMRGRPRVLIVDDNADMRDYIVSLLRPEYEVATANDGREALDVVHTQVPDLVLSDVNMPRLDGFGLLAALREDPTTMHVPLVMLSARAGEEGTVEGLEAGADDYLIKPFSSRELLARVSSNLELDRVRRTGEQLKRSVDMQNRAEQLADVGSWEINLADGHVHASDHLLAMLGLDRDDLGKVEDRRWFERFIAAEDRPWVSGVVAAALATGSPVECDARLAPGAVEPAGERWIRLRSEVVLDEAGSATAMHGCIQDITSQREGARAVIAAAAARKEAEYEHSVADALQRSLLPEPVFVSSHLRVSSFYRAGVAGTRAGGDFYDAIDLGAGRVALVIGDITGRGLQAASMMGQLRAAIRAYARLDLPPGELLDLLDHLVRELCDGRLVTCIYGIFDPVAKELHYASAGHLPPLLATPGAVPLVLPGATGPPLGTGSGLYEERRVPVGDGARIVFYTDGLVERRGEDLDRAIERLARQLSDDVVLEELPGHLVRAAQAATVDDDVAILVAEVLSAQSLETAEFDVSGRHSSVREARHFAGAVLGGWGIAADRTADAVLIVSELVTNAIVHGAQPIRLRLRRIGAELAIEVDDGASAMPRRLNSTAERPHGRGLALIGAISTRWAARGRDCGKTVWATIPARPLGG